MQAQSSNMHAQLQHAHKASYTSAGPVSAQQHRDVRAAARNKSGQYRQQQQDNSSQRSTDYEQLIAPISITDVSSVADIQYAALPDYVGQVQLSSSRSSSKGGRPGKPTSTRHDGRRGSLVKIRVPPRRYVRLINWEVKGPEVRQVHATRGEGGRGGNVGSQDVA